MVSNYDRLSELSEQAAESQDASTLQVLKTMDSISAKTQQLQTSIQSLYVEGGFEELYKGALDFGNGIATALNNLDKIGGKPLAAIMAIGATFYNLANIVSTSFELVKARLSAQGATLSGRISNSFREAADSITQALNAAADQVSQAFNRMEQKSAATGQVMAENIQNPLSANPRSRMTRKAQQGPDAFIYTPFRERLKGSIEKNHAAWSMGLSAASLAVSGIATRQKDRRAQGGLNVLSGGLSGAEM